MANDQRGLGDFGKWKNVWRGLQWTPMSAPAAPEGRFSPELSRRGWAAAGSKGFAEEKILGPQIRPTRLQIWADVAGDSEIDGEGAGSVSWRCMCCRLECERALASSSSIRAMDLVFQWTLTVVVVDDVGGRGRRRRLLRRVWRWRRRTWLSAAAEDVDGDGGVLEG